MIFLKQIPIRITALLTTVLLLMTLAAGSAWRWQENSYSAQLSAQARDYERQLSQRDELHAYTLAEIGRAAAAQNRRNQEQRQLLEQELLASSETQYRKLTDAEKIYNRLRDRLATAELRLSVLVANPASGGCDTNGMPAPANAGCLVDGALRAEVDSGVAQRIIGIAAYGDRAIIALTACQGYVRRLSKG